MSLLMAAVLEVMLAVHFHELDTGVVAIVSTAVCLNYCESVPNDIYGHLYNSVL